MIPLFKVRMSELAESSVAAVLASGYIGQGKYVDMFEEELQRKLHTNLLPVTVNSCTSAIDLALELYGVGPGDEVISTPQTCFASNVGVIHRGARIRWADIDPITGLMNSESAGKLVTSKTKAIIAVNWAGKFADYKALKAFGVPVIEDAAHTWDEFLKPGSIERGDIVCYSLQAIKFVTSSDGGVMVIENEELNHRARLLRWYGLDRTKSESFRCTQNITQAGFKYHMNDVCAVIGLANLKDSFVAVDKHRMTALRLGLTVNELDYVVPQEFDINSSYWMFPMIIKGDRERFVRYLEENGVASSQVHFRNDMYDSTLQFKEKPLPGLDYFSEHQVNIPCGWWLSDDDIEHILKVLREYRDDD